MVRKPREAVTPAVIGLAGAGLALALAALPAVGALDRWTADLRIAHLTPAEPQHAEVVVVAITEESLAALPYRSPVDRGFLADVVAGLRAAGVRAVGLDVLIDQPTEPERDRRLRDELARPGGAPAVAVWADPARPLTAAQRAYHEDFLRGLSRGSGGLVTDPFDGAVRRYRPGPRAPGEPPGLAGALAEGVGVALPPGELRLAYRAGPSAATPPFATYPAHGVALLPREWLAGRIALVGAVLPDVDRHRTPLSVGAGAGPTPGVVIHAHALAQLLDGRRLAVAGPGLEAAVALLFAGAGVGLALLTRLAWPLRALLGALLLAGLWVGAFALFAAGGPLLGLMAPTVALPAAAGLGAAHLGRRQRFIRRAFEHYLAPAVVARLAASPDGLKLGGERREVTILFTDLAGFTTLTEGLAPEPLIGLVNDYLDGMIGIALAHEATVGRVVGDALHLMFNAPDDQPDHPRRAVACALALDRFAEAFAADRRARGVPFGLTRIGVHTGFAAVGNFGGRRRFDYTAHGDVVNTAARLEGANKYLGTRVCVSGATAGRCPDVAWRPVGDLVLAGKSAPVAAFVPAASADGRDGGADLAAAYGDAFAKLRAGDPCARAAFEALLARRPDDPLAALHLARLRRGEAGARIVLEGK